MIGPIDALYLDWAIGTWRAYWKLWSYYSDLEAPLFLIKGSLSSSSSSSSEFDYRIIFGWANLFFFGGGYGGRSVTFLFGISSLIFTVPNFFIYTDKAFATWIDVSTFFFPLPLSYASKNYSSLGVVGSSSGLPYTELTIINISLSPWI